MLLCDAVCLENVVFQFLLGLSRAENKKREKEHALVLALQFLEQRLGIIPVSRKIRRDDVHVVAGADRLLLFLDLGPVQLRDGVLHLLDRLGLIHGLHMHGHDFR